MPVTSTGRGATGHFVLVLHSHMPYLKRAGNWPVGEEWLFQAWGEAYLRVADLLQREAELGRRHVLTLGLTPLILHQMSDHQLLERFHAWIGHAMVRCEMLAANAASWPDTGARRRAASFWWCHYKAMLDSFESKGCKLVPCLRDLATKETIEVLGGPLTHAYLPLHNDDTVVAQLRLGLDEGERLLGHRTRGIWLPECAYRPGLEKLLEDCGIEYVVLDGPTILRAAGGTGDGTTALRRAWRIGHSSVAAVGRDLDVTYRVWSPTGGYPGHGAYREYHRWESETGLKLWRVTDKKVPQEDKELYDPALIPETVAAQVRDFRALTRGSVTQAGDVVVACYDTELFGHWWLEGPDWLRGLLDALADDTALRPTTLGHYIDEVGTAGSLAPPAGSWGLRKDFSIWENEDTAEMWDALGDLDRRLRAALDAEASSPRATLDPTSARLLVQAVREAALAQCSDWPFMIGHGKSADYAGERFRVHADAAHRCLDTYEALAGDPTSEGAISNHPTSERAVSDRATSAVDIGWLDGLEADHDVAPELDMTTILRAYRGWEEA